MGIFKKKKRFILSDETENSYGFTILTDGIDTTRFETNPVMLDGHMNDNERVLGAWDDVIVDKQNRLTALPVFDTEDEKAKRIAAKVESGFIRGASVGIMFNPDDMKKKNGRLILEKCELIEASIVAVPSNKNALRLYNTEGKLMKPDEVNELCMSVGKPSNQTFNDTMEKQTIQLSVTALAVLGFDATQIERLQASDINEAVLKLHNEREQLKKDLESYKEKEKQAQAAEKARLDARNAKLVDDAIKAGKITAEKRDHYLKMAEFDYDMASEQLTSAPQKGSLGAGLNPITGKEMTMDEFEKLDTATQLKWKDENPEAYKKMVE